MLLYECPVHQDVPGAIFKSRSCSVYYKVYEVLLHQYPGIRKCDHMGLFATYKVPSCRGHYMAKSMCEPLSDRMTPPGVVSREDVADHVYGWHSKRSLVGVGA